MLYIINLSSILPVLDAKSVNNFPSKIRLTISISIQNKKIAAVTLRLYNIITFALVIFELSTIFQR